MVAATATIACLLASTSAALAAGDVNRSSCGAFAGTESSPGFRSFLPDCRAYELVTPPYEGGQAAFGTFGAPPEMSSDGEHLVGVDFAGFAGTGDDEEGGAFEFGAHYEFSRTPDSPACLSDAHECWSTEALAAPAALAARQRFVRSSADLSRSLWQLVMQPSEGEEVPQPNERGYTFAVREPRGAGGSCPTASHPVPNACFTVVGPPIAPEHEPERPTGNAYSVEGASRDLTHILFSINSELHQLWPGDTTHEGTQYHPVESLYEYDGTGNREPVLVGVKNAGALEGVTHLNEHAELISECGTRLGSAGEASDYNAVSADGSVVYFTALHTEGCSGAQPAANELYARIDGAKTLDISEPASPECTGECATAPHSAGVFQGASEDGSKVFFTTAQPLLDGDEEGMGSGQDLYEAELQGGAIKRLVQVSHDPTPGKQAEVAGVARISEDGSHVYYVAKGLLTTAPNGEGEVAEQGAYNLYVYDTNSGGTAFVASLMTNPEVQEVRSGRLKERTEEIETEVKEELEAKEEECAEEHPAGKAREKCDLGAQEEAEAEEAELLSEFEAEELPEYEAEVALIRVRVPPLTHESDEAVPFETTPDGGFLVFVNARHLTGTEDTSTVGQVFRYDAQTQTLVRVSAGQTSAEYPAGYGDDGNTTNTADAPQILSPDTFTGGANPTEVTSALSVSEEGVVVFVSADQLTPQAVAGQENVYEYREGNVYLISPGDEAVSLDKTRLLGIDEDASDVFFVTTDSLVPQDTDTQGDWYDARVGGGFPAPTVPAGCTGEACQGPLGTTPPLSAAAGSATQTPGENSHPRPPVAAKTVTFSVRSLDGRQRRDLVRTGHGLLAVSTSAAGRITVRVTAKLDNNTETVARYIRTLYRGGETAHIRLTLSRAARQALLAHGSLKITLVVSFSKARGTRRVAALLHEGDTRGQRRAK